MHLNSSIFMVHGKSVFTHARYLDQVDTGVGLDVKVKTVRRADVSAAVLRVVNDVVAEGSGGAGA